MLLKHSGIYLLSRIIPAVINFIAIAYYTRFLSTSHYGEYSLYMVTIGILNVLIFEWLRSSLLRFYSNYNEEKKITFMSTIFCIYGSLITLIIILSLIVYLLNKTSDIRTWSIGTLLLILIAWFELNISILRAELNPLRSGMLLIVKSILTLIISVILLKNGLGINSIFIATCAGILISSIYLSFKKWINMVCFKKVDWKLAKKLLIYGLPITLALSVGIIIQTSDRYLIKLLGSSEDVGIYSVGYDLANNTIYVLMSAISSAAFPLAVNALNIIGIQEAERKVENNIKLFAIISIPATVGLICISNNLSYVLLGKDFQEYAKYVIQLISVAALLHGLKSFCIDVAFQLGNKPKLYIIPNVCAVILNLVLNLILIPPLGIYGSCIASILSYLVALLISWNLGKKVFKIIIDLKVWKEVILASIIMSFFIIIVPDINILTLVSKLIIGVISYGVSLLIFNTLDLRSKINSSKKRFSLYRKNS
ncbi:lipopolysaccharide biosynthesis protein [Priestia koreensis]|uniref:lipopolysaccharide biosynthesis protein n=1 Tax=Priestia koreensis TaxID=284581 RepID=UPI001F55C015|nr:oligosaccharide flippase family protein [Priestia koreensis]UNL85794.1 oligosaccharide flippase family protein [Priestia koreensis]